MREHELKTLPTYWQAIASGEKTFEVRRDDRGFQRGDVLLLQRLEKTPLGGWRVETDYNGKPAYVLRRVVKWILTGGQFGVEPGYVVMSIADEPKKD